MHFSEFVTSSLTTSSAVSLIWPRLHSARMHLVCNRAQGTAVGSGPNSSRLTIGRRLKDVPKLEQSSDCCMYPLGAGRVLSVPEPLFMGLSLFTCRVWSCIRVPPGN